jgi:hypothetical protein
VDTSAQIVLVNPTSNIPVWRGSVGELLKAISRVGAVIATGSIIDGTITDADIATGADIGIEKLDTTSADGVVSKSRLSNALDDVGSGGGSGGIWEEENSNTLASDNTTDNYHQGNIGIGDFSSNTIGATIHAYDVTNTRLRLSDQATTDTAATAYIEYYRGYATNQLGAVGFLNNTDVDFDIKNNLTGGGIGFYTDATEKMKLYADGQLRLHTYGDTTHTDGRAATKYLAVDENGWVIPADAGSTTTAGTPSGPADSSGSEGDIWYDANFGYIKTASGWRRWAISSWSVPVSDTLQEIGSLGFIFDAQAEIDSSNYTNGDPVTLLTDFSSNGFDATSGGSSAPIIQTNAINGRAALFFDGVNDSLIIADNATLSALDSFQVFVVGRFVDLNIAADPTHIITKGMGDVDEREWGITLRADSTIQARVFQESTDDVTVQTTTTKYDSSSYSIIMMVYSDDSDLVNSTIDQGGTNPETTTVNIEDRNAPIKIGANQGGTKYKMEIAEIVFFTKRLSSSELSTIYTYFNNRYNL